MSRKLKFGLIAIALIVIIGGAIFLWQVKIGRVKLSAQTELCQNSGQLGQIYGASQWSVASQLMPVRFLGKTVLFHKKAAPWLKMVARDIREKKSTYKINNADTFNWRIKTTGYGQSLHSYGIAIDINPQSNPYSFSGQLQTDMPENFIRSFRKYHFYWGGDWKGFVDPMHFEWYGAELRGRIIDKNTKEEISGVDAYVDDKKIVTIGKDYYLAIPEGRHTIVLKNPKYKDYRFKIRVSCNQIFERDIQMQPIPLGVPGKISGKVFLPSESPLELPASIYIDGVYAQKSNVDGSFTVSDVPGGLNHIVEAKIIPIFTGSVKVKVIPGKTTKNVDIIAVPGMNR